MIYILSLINLLSFIIFGWDKRLAIRHGRRVSENTLLGISLLGGIGGAALGMVVFNHKVSKKSFLVKFILVVLIDVVILYRMVRH